MAAPTTIDDFLDLVTRSGVSDGTRLQSYVTRLRSTDGLPKETTQLAGLLVRDGLLTYFQAEQILQGKWRRFTIGKYKILERLGSGGMGQVFLCEHQLMKNRVAVKVLPIAQAKNESSLLRFYREAKAAAALDHPNVVRAYDIDKDDQLHFLVMDYVDGSSLHEIVKRCGPMEVGRVCKYVSDAAKGLQFALENGVVHRDIKPGNILVDRTGCVKILDMGLARFFNDEEDDITKKFEEVVLGTADYLAPEQAVDSHSVDVRADIYSLGGTMYYMLTGRPPFVEGTVAQKLLWHQTREPEPIEKYRPDLPREVVAILRKMMAKSRTDRYQVPLEVIAALEPFVPDNVSPPPEKEMPQLSLAAQQQLGSSPSSILRSRQLNKAKPEMPKSEVSANLPASASTVAVQEPEHAFSAIAAETLEVAKHDTGPTTKVNPAKAPQNPFKTAESPAASKAPGTKWVSVLLAIPLLAGAVWYFGFRDKSAKQPSAEKIVVKNLYVSKSGQGDCFPTLKAALEKAEEDSHIVIRDPVWEESVTIHRPKKGLVIEGESGKAPPIWRAKNSSAGGSMLVLHSCAGLTIRNLVLDADTGKWDEAIKIIGPSPGLSVEEVEFHGGRTACLVVSAARGEAERPMIVQNCRFLGKAKSVAGNSSSEKGTPIYKVSRTISLPRAYDTDWAIDLQTNQGDRNEVLFLTVRDCRFEGQTPDGFRAALSIQCNVRECIFANNRLMNLTYGIFFADGPNAPVSRLHLENNTFYSLSEAAFCFEKGSRYAVAKDSKIEIRRNFFSGMPTTIRFLDDQSQPDSATFYVSDNAGYQIKTASSLIAAREVNEYLDSGSQQNRNFLYYPKTSPLFKMAEGKPIGAVPPEWTGPDNEN